MIQYAVTAVDISIDSNFEPKIVAIVADIMYARNIAITYMKEFAKKLKDEIDVDIQIDEYKLHADDGFGENGCQLNIQEIEIGVAIDVVPSIGFYNYGIKDLVSFLMLATNTLLLHIVYYFNNFFLLISNLF